MTTDTPTLPDSILDDWRSNKPALMLAALRAMGIGDEDERLVAWVRELRREAGYTFVDNETACVGVWGNGYHLNVPMPTRAAFLDCLFGGEFAAERVVCRWCNGHTDLEHEEGISLYDMSQCRICHGLGSVKATVECKTCSSEGQVRRSTRRHERVEKITCPSCFGQKRIPAPLIDPRWLSPTVIDMAKVIWGIECWDCDEPPDQRYVKQCNDCNGKGNNGRTSRFERMPILADALMDEGCDNEEVIRHCQAGGPHLPQCWVIAAILRGN